MSALGPITDRVMPSSTTKTHEAYASSNDTPRMAVSSFDASRWQPELVDVVDDLEIGAANSVRSDRRSENTKGLHHASGIVGRASDENIEGSASAWQTVSSQRMGPHDDELDVRREEGTEQVDELSVELRLQATSPLHYARRRCAWHDLRHGYATWRTSSRRPCAVANAAAR